MNIISVFKVCKTYKSKTTKKILKLFNELSLSIDDSCSLISIIGEDGSGKSTLLKLLASVEKADSGSISILNLKFEDNPNKYLKNIGYMSQTLDLYEELSVFNNLEILSALKDFNVKEKENYLIELLKKVNLYNFKDYKVASLSGGMKQKLALVIAIAQKPKVLLLDEPTVGVDPVSRKELWDIILDYIKTEHALCLFSSLYLEESAYSDKTIFLKDGKILLFENEKEIKKVASNLTYRLEIPLNVYQDTLYHLIEHTKASDDNSPILDICPRLGFIDTLLNKNCQIDDLKSYLKKLSINNLTINKREPLLEDAYILLSSKNTKFDYDACNKDIDKDKIIIKVKNIKKVFGNFIAVDDSTFNIHEGEIFGLLGPNGAGKTTTFRMICALLTPSFGEIKIDNVDLLKDKTKIREKIGYVAQKFCLYKKMTVKANMDYFASAYGLSKQEKKERIAYFLEKFNLKNYENEISADVPFGITRKLSICCALMHNPRILFLDEATSGADPQTRRDFWRFILKLKKSGTSIVVTTHFMEEAEYCDRFLIQDKGKILVLGSPKDICTKNNKRISVEETFINLINENRRA